MNHTRAALKVGSAAIVLALALTACSGDSGRGGQAASPVVGASSAAVTTGSPPPPIGDSTPPPNPKASGGNPAAVQVDGTDAGAVSQAAALTMHLYDTEIDTSRHDALLRTAPLLDRAYLVTLRTQTPRPVQGGDWGIWTSHRAYMTATATENREMGQPPDNLLEAFRTWVVTITPHGRDGWEGEPQVAVVFVTLRRDAPDQAWRVMNLQGD